MTHALLDPTEEGRTTAGAPAPGGALVANDVSLSYGGPSIVDGLSLAVPPGRVTVLVGANGCGKSTLLRGLSRLLSPSSGTVTLDGESVHRMPPRALARRLALLPQSPVTPDALTVRELVGHGRAPYRGAFRREGSEDRAAVDRALAATHLEDLAGRPVADLSGGQRQRAWIAMTLAQETDVLLLDEPTTYLDLAHQVDVLDTIAALNRRRGTTVVMVLHDLNLAARYADHLVAMRDGRIVAGGTPSEVVTSETVREVFGLDTVVVPDPVTGTPLVVPASAPAPEAVPAASIAPAAPGDAGEGLGDAAGPAAPASASMPGSGEGSGAGATAEETTRAGGAARSTSGATAAETEATLAFRTTIREARDLGRGLRRLTLAGEDLQHFGTGSDPLDLRIKLLVPAEGADAQSIAASIAPLFPDAAAGEPEEGGWYRRWLSAPVSARGEMRTYTARALREQGGEVLLDVDLVLHGVDENGVPGEGCGPAAAFAAAAQPGDVLHVLGPNRALCDADYGGIDFRPGQAKELLLVGDETAAPALCSILDALPRDARGSALIEVPDAGHVQKVYAPVGVGVRWLVRGATDPVGTLLDPVVRLAAGSWAAKAGGTGAGLDPEDVDVDEVTLWEAPTGNAADAYAWIAGEAGVVKALRRHLVRDFGVDRTRVAFMGYWRAGRAGV